MILMKQVGAALVLVVLTLCLQCAGVAALIGWLRRIVGSRLRDLRMFHSGALVMQTTIGIIILHGMVILLWASCYRGICFPSWESAFYFSASSYTTVGYGDVVLPLRWRLLGPLESMVGMLMSGISVGLLFAMITHLVEVKSRSALPLRSEPTNADQIGIR
jgi:voltage-gated potassium channel